MKEEAEDIEKMTKLKTALLEFVEQKKPLWLWAAKNANKDCVVVLLRLYSSYFYDGPFPIFVNSSDVAKNSQFLKDIEKSDCSLLKVYHVDLCKDEIYKPDFSTLTTASKQVGKIGVELSQDIEGGMKMIPSFVSKKLQIKAMQSEFDDMQKEYRNSFKLSEFINEANKNVDAIKQALESKKTKLVLKESIANWLKMYSGGKEGGHKYKVMWQSEDGRYGIVYIPGGPYWSGRGETSYAPSECMLFDAILKPDNGMYNTIIHSFKEGSRFSKKMVAEAEEFIAKYKTNENR